MAIRYAVNHSNKVPKCPKNPEHPIMFRTYAHGRKKHFCDVCLVQTCHYDCGLSCAANPQCRPQKNPTT